MAKLNERKMIYDWVVVGKTFSANIILSFLYDYFIKKESDTKKIAWVSGSGSQFISPLNILDSAEAAPLVAEACSRLGIDFGEVHFNSSVLEFKNKGFRDAFWRKGLKARELQEFQSRVADLWFPEQGAINFEECTFSQTLIELNRKIAARLENCFSVLNETIEQVTDVAGKISEAISEGAESTCLEIKFSSGAEIFTRKIIYADHLNVNGRNVNLLYQPQSKKWSFLKGSINYGAVQVHFTHNEFLENHTSFGPLKTESTQNYLDRLGYSFFGPINRDSGENFDRNVWGYFFQSSEKNSTKLQSCWTVFLTSEETESNHLIGKKIRKLKQALEKMFGDQKAELVGLNLSEPYTGPYKEQKSMSFLDSIVSEQVCFENALLAEDMKLEGPEKNLYRTIIDHCFYLTTEALGVSTGLKQCASLLRKLDFISENLKILDRAENPGLEHSLEEGDLDNRPLVLDSNPEWQEQLA